jgi:hypothetical protein
MKKYIPDSLGAAGYCLLVAGLYVQFGLGVALIGGGVLLMVGAWLWGRP